MRLTVINLTNKAAFYNFLCTFMRNPFRHPANLYGRAGFPLLKRKWRETCRVTLMRARRVLLLGTPDDRNAMQVLQNKSQRHK